MFSHPETLKSPLNIQYFGKYKLLSFFFGGGVIQSFSPCKTRMWGHNWSVVKIIRNFALYPFPIDSNANIAIVITVYMVISQKHG